jgi:hypothetical protein
MTNPMQPIVRRVSKHAAQRKHKRPNVPKPGEGRVRIYANSSLKKLMRAARRGMVPDDRLFTIFNAMVSAGLLSA